MNNVGKELRDAYRGYTDEDEVRKWLKRYQPDIYVSKHTIAQIIALYDNCIDMDKTLKQFVEYYLDNPDDEQFKED